MILMILLKLLFDLLFLIYNILLIHYHIIFFLCHLFIAFLCLYLIYLNIHFQIQRIMLILANFILSPIFFQLMLLILLSIKMYDSDNKLITTINDL
jgi:hypothetical protein